MNASGAGWRGTDVWTVAWLTTGQTSCCCFTWRHERWLRKLRNGDGLSDFGIKCKSSFGNGLNDEYWRSSCLSCATAASWSTFFQTDNTSVVSTGCSVGVRPAYKSSNISTPMISAFHFISLQTGIHPPLPTPSIDKQVKHISAHRFH